MCVCILGGDGAVLSCGSEEIDRPPAAACRKWGRVIIAYPRGAKGGPRRFDVVACALSDYCAA